ncbi:MAG: outer membrane protein assembly factor BamA [Myxococcota bacterium]|jgi:outer membrane protein assembly factor BamA
MRVARTGAIRSGSSTRFLLIRAPNASARSAVLLVILTALPAVAQDDDSHPCQGLPISGLQLEGCEGNWCDETAERAKLLSLIDLRPGMIWDEGRVTRIRLRLEETGFFRAVEEHCSLPGDGTRARILVRVHPNRWIRDVQITGARSLFESDVLKRMFLRPGRALNPDDEFGLSELKRQRDLLQRRFQKEGFDDANVSIRHEAVGTDGIVLFVDIVEGPKKKVTAIAVNIEVRRPELVEGADASTLPFEGARCPTFTRRELRQASELRPGDVFTRRKQKTTRRNLVRFLRSRGLVDPEVTVEYDAETRRSTIDVAYGRCWLLRFRVRNDPAVGRAGFGEPEDEEALLSRLTFSEAGVFYLEEAERSRAGLEAYYQQQGYLFADVQLDWRKSILKRPERGVHGVVSFYITLNYQSEVRNITFRGNKTLDDEALIADMATRPYDFFGTGGYLIVDRMFADMARLQQAYQGKGYYALTFSRARKRAEQEDRVNVARRREGEDYVYDWTLRDLHFAMRKHPEESVIYLEIDIDEGPISEVGVVAIKVAGDKQPAGDPELALVKPMQELVQLKNGAPYSPTDVSRDRGRLERYLQKQGHHLARIETNCIAYGEGRTTLPSCEWRTVRARRVDITHRVTPGPRMMVGEVFVRGTDRTVRSLVIDKLPRRGDRLNRIALDEAEASIRGLGVFSSVELRLIGLDQTDQRDRVAIVLFVHERDARFLDFSTGIEQVVEDSSSGTREQSVPLFGSTATNAIGVVDLSLRGPGEATPLNLPNVLFFLGTSFRHRNFLGRAMELEVPFRYGAAFPQFSDTESREDSWVDAFTRLIELRPQLRERRLFGTDIQTTLELFARYDTATGLKDELETGGGITFSTTFFDRLGTSLSFTGSGINVSDDLPAKLRSDSPGALFEPKFSVDLTANLDFMDNPIHPTEGFAVATRVRYILEPLEDTGEFENFVKADISLRGAIRFRRFLILAGWFRYATSFVDGLDLPDEERYKLGGIFGLRGLEDGSVRVTDSEGIPDASFEGGNSLLAGTLELRIPILKREAFGLWAAAFFDWGGLSRTFDFAPAAVRTTAGVGIRLLLSGIPIRVDVGFNLDPRCATGDGRAVVDSKGRCVFGEEGLSESQFGLLYTF